MSPESPKSNTVLIVIAIIGVAGTIVASAIGAITNYNIEQQRQVFELTRAALVSIVTQSGVTQAALQGTADAPTITPYPTQTPQPTYTPYPTFTSLPTYTPIRSTPTLSLILPFQDSFDGNVRPEWQILNGELILQDGWLGAARDSVILGIGDDTLTNFTLDFDYKNLRGVNEILVTFDRTVRLVVGQDGSGWQAFRDGDWTNFSLFGGVGVSGHLTINVSENLYRAFRDQDLIQEITYGTPVGGPIMITIVADRYIDNFSMTSQ
jgi:hypothetical protein